MYNEESRAYEEAMREYPKTQRGIGGHIPTHVTCPHCKKQFPFPYRGNIQALVVYFWQKGSGKKLLSDDELKTWLPF